MNLKAEFKIKSKHKDYCDYWMWGAIRIMKFACEPVTALTETLIWRFKSGSWFIRIPWVIISSQRRWSELLNSPVLFLTLAPSYKHLCWTTRSTMATDVRLMLLVSKHTSVCASPEVRFTWALWSNTDSITESTQKNEVQLNVKKSITVYSYCSRITVYSYNTVYGNVILKNITHFMSMF